MTWPFPQWPMRDACCMTACDRQRDRLQQPRGVAWRSRRRPRSQLPPKQAFVLGVLYWGVELVEWLIDRDPFGLRSQRLFPWLISLVLVSPSMACRPRQDPIDTAPRPFILKLACT